MCLDIKLKYFFIRVEIFTARQNIRILGSAIFVFTVFIKTRLKPTKGNVLIILNV